VAVFNRFILNLIEIERQAWAQNNFVIFFQGFYQLAWLFLSPPHYH
jgi:hypothetical protein